MTKYVRLTPDRSALRSGLFSTKPRNIQRHDDADLPKYNWFPVEEHFQPSPDSELYQVVFDSWELIGDVVHFHYTTQLIDIESRREILTNRVDAHRDTILENGLEFAGHRFDTKRTALVRVLGKWTSATVDESVTTFWISEENDTIFLSNENLRLFGRAFEQFEEQNVMRARQIKDQILSSSSPEEIDIYANWPENKFYSDVELDVLDVNG